MARRHAAARGRAITGTASVVATAAITGYLALRGQPVSTSPTTAATETALVQTTTTSTVAPATTTTVKAAIPATTTTTAPVTSSHGS